MRIVLIHQYFLETDGAGISRFNQFAKYWTEAGHEVTVVCGTVHYMTGKKQHRFRGRLITKERENPRLEVVRVFVSDAYNSNFIGRMWGYVSFTMSSLLALLTIQKPDVIISTSPPLFAGVPGLVASWAWRRPFVFEVRDLWPESAIELGVLNNKLLISLAYAAEKLLYRSAKKICVLTPAFREKLASEKNVPRDKIFFIPNGADTDLLVIRTPREEVRRNLGLGNSFTVLYIGAHGIANHLDQVLDAASLVKDDPSLRFVLVGEGMKKEELKKRANREGLANLLFLDPVPKDRIADIINACDVGLAVLKKLDIFKTVYPNKVFDYMACKRPVLLGIDGAIRELVETSAKVGVFFEPEQAHDMVEKIRTMQGNPAQCSQFGENGYTFVTRHYSRKALACAYERELTGCLASH